jgi:uncharacterized DUF497 family protein
MAYPSSRQFEYSTIHLRFLTWSARSRGRNDGTPFGLAGGVIVLLLVVYTIEDENGEEKIRIISARKAGPRERALYEPLN